MGARDARTGAKRVCHEGLPGVGLMRPVTEHPAETQYSVYPLLWNYAPNTTTWIFCVNRPGKEVIADGLQYVGANRAHNQKAGAEERVCETSQASEALKEMQVPAMIL